MATCCWRNWALRCTAPRLILWPSYIGDSDPEQAVLCAAYREGARVLARALGAWVLQSNWSEGRNQPGVTGFGGSLVLAPDGSTVATLPRDAATLELVMLNDRPFQARRIRAA